MSGTGDEGAGSARIAVVRGGAATDGEIAAIVIALTPVRRDDGDPPDVRASAWAHAARLEGVGQRPAVSLADLEGRLPV